MKLIRFDNINKFLEQVQPVLVTSEAENNLILGVCLHIQTNPDRYKEKYLCLIIQNNELVAIAVCTPPFKLLLWCKNKQVDFSILIADLIQAKLEMSGVLTENALALRFAEIWKQKTSENYKPGMSERIYELTEVIFPESMSGKMRLVKMDDLELICQWMKEFHKEAIPNDPLGDFEKFATLKIENNDLVIWEYDDQPVSLASRARPTINGICINLVYTPVEYRRKGYASSLVAHFCQKLLNDGWKFITLFTDLSNPTSNSIYQKVGFRSICDFQEYFFEK